MDWQEQYEIDKARYQSLCPICGKAFMYAPVKDEVRQLEDGQFAHEGCNWPE